MLTSRGVSHATALCHRCFHNTCQVSIHARIHSQDFWTKLGRLSFPWSLFAYPFYLWKRSPGKTGSHYDPACDLFQPSEKNMVLTSDAFMIGMLGVLAACTAKLGVVAMFNLYFMPYW